MESSGSQGPLFPAMTLRHLIQTPGTMVRYALPPWMSTKRDFEHYVQDHQAVEASSQGWSDNDELSGIRKEYGQIFDIHHFESAVRSRFRDAVEPPNLIGAIEQALAAMLGISVSRVNGLRGKAPFRADNQRMD